MSKQPHPEFEPSSQDGISLDELTQAFARAMEGDNPETAESVSDDDDVSLGAAEGEGADTQLAVDGDAAESETRQSPDDANSLREKGITLSVEGDDVDEEAGNDASEISPRTILEAMLFVGDSGNAPLSAARASEIMRGVEPGEIAQLVDELNRSYASNACPYRIVHDGGGYRMSLRGAFHGVRNKFYGRVREAKLSQAAIDVLAIVAYQQPITAEQVQRLRGKPGGHVLSQLVRRGLLRIEREGKKRRAAMYLTTDRFLKLFGLDSIEDLPQSAELDA